MEFISFCEVYLPLLKKYSVLVNHDIRIRISILKTRKIPPSYPPGQAETLFKISMLFMIKNIAH